MTRRDLVGVIIVLVVAGVAWLFVTTVVRADRYDPTADPNVQSYLVCVQLSSGGGDNSSVPDASNFDQVGYVTWSDGLQKALLCQEVDKP